MQDVPADIEEQCSVSIQGTLPQEPADRVLLMAKVAESIARVVGEGPADAMMTLVTAAAVILIDNAKEPMSAGELESVLAQGAAHAAKLAAEMLPDQLPTVQ